MKTHREEAEQAYRAGFCFYDVWAIVPMRTQNLFMSIPLTMFLGTFEKIVRIGNTKENF